eukprot:243023-Chlamydomonas_euryale.AAC.3
MRNQKPAAVSDPHPFAIRAPFTEVSVYEPSTPAMTCHIVQVEVRGLQPWLVRACTLAVWVRPHGMSQHHLVAVAHSAQRGGGGGCGNGDGGGGGGGDG